MKIATPWVYSPKFDLWAIIGPPVVITTIVLIWGRQIAAIDQIPPWLWIVLVLGIDVAHVYSSLFRTYFDRDEFARRRKLYIMVPLLAWGVGVALYALFGPVLFWSVVAYFAIYHFVRQQYGFLMLYRRGEPVGDLSYRIDQIAIYLATVIPLIHWHTYPRNFQWFEEFDVARTPAVWPEYIFRALYIVSLALFVIKELMRWYKSGRTESGIEYAVAA